MTVSVNFRTATSAGVLLITDFNHDLKYARVDARDYLAKRYGVNINVEEGRKARKTNSFQPYTVPIGDFSREIKNVFVRYN